MNCQDFLERMHPYFDGELDAQHSLALEEHLRDCPRCAALLTAQQALRERLHSQALHFDAPPDLRKSIRASLAPERPTRSASSRLSVRFGLFWGIPAMALIVLLCLFAGVYLQNSRQDRIVRELASCHIRSLMGSHLLDVPSTDQHTVKPWFNGKLDFAPTVKDFNAEGFPLVGGRLDYVGGRTAAALVYRHRNHVINLFVWPTPQTTGSSAISRDLQGFHLVGWSDADLQYWAVSDLNEPELQDFVALWRK